MNYKSKINDFYFSKKAAKKYKGKPQTEEIFKIHIHITNNLSPIYLKNCYNSLIRVL